MQMKHVISIKVGGKNAR